MFTNLTQDHLDFHVDMERYFQAKLKLFVELGRSGARKERKRAIINGDDPGAGGCAGLHRSCLDLWLGRAGGPSRAEDVRLSAAGTDFTLRSPAGTCTIQSRLVGEHNVPQSVCGDRCGPV